MVGQHQPVRGLQRRDRLYTFTKRVGGGSIVNIGSSAGLRGYPSAVGHVSSKWAIRGLTKTAAIEIGTHGIRVNTVHPGQTHTPATVKAPFKTDHVALKRVGGVRGHYPGRPLPRRRRLALDHRSRLQCRRRTRGRRHPRAERPAERPHRLSRPAGTLGFERAMRTARALEECSTTWQGALITAGR
ncbi:SDR family NAD(P)-dependent oxidoreductase [Streptomyces sp. NPDC051217]|uniref:SDR family NAD(P)-dependent oxidoreductase n=1 Tax=Streptomyces sp. NPDC051217 TaxID=3365644 RepID=UPI0037AC634E